MRVFTIVMLVLFGLSFLHALLLVVTEHSVSLWSYLFAAFSALVGTAGWVRQEVRADVWTNRAIDAEEALRKLKEDAA